ncbi:C-5 sterol desaturase KNAG_0L00320 [Huiozyma naganishii CBS 8797]|uniref:Fatty acid hydroxylase domain-containing protein n=1 Tax=Huiozyma naganishii (strain ATCC MYA-139 / BCRC 22969 / CBS 8797 / KCTC 17520 / NBRC 10181 / NCYC 3082 / Yp74L-3) TaxID=1071383 RepID=J7RCQ7_HUIN7|nr:hypothetical protein KNAG_0L00320 [Kazachstania naganishii CBS 8797]CCK72655.1 hypothetical protein KNAG_0L00320 [Kazachstania naganishii CBS 8797]
MDLVLETVDTFVFDKVYSKLFPYELIHNVGSEWINKLDLQSYAADNCTMLSETVKMVNSQPHVNMDVYGHTPFLFDVTDYTFKSLLPRYNLIREAFSLWIIVTFFGWLLYLSFATMSYIFVFDRTIFNHPRYLQNQLRMEMKLALSAIPWMSLLTVPWFVLELNGHSKLYWSDPKKDWTNIVKEIASFIFFTDCGVYLAHRWLHWPNVYRILHKPHHKWLVCTPFASHAFNPVDGYFQSLPYHLYPMIFPLQKASYLCLFTFVNFWTIMIHDGNHMYNNKIVNGTACHTVHHLYFSYNFGQFTTLWDRLGGSYRRPEDALFDKSPIKDEAALKEQLEQVELEMKLLEGDNDERVYIEKKKA